MLSRDKATIDVHCPFPPPLPSPADFSYFGREAKHGIELRMPLPSGVPLTLTFLRHSEPQEAYCS